MKEMKTLTIQEETFEIVDGAARKGLEEKQPKGKYLTDHQPIKTVNGQSLVGEGNLEIESGSGVDEVAREKIASLTEEIAGEEELQFIPVVLNVSTDGYYGKDGAFVPTASNRGYASVDVSHGDKYRLSTVVGSTAIPAIVKYGADGAFIGFEKAGTGNKEQVVDYEFVIEENVSRIVVQTAYENNQPKLALEKETVVKTKSFYTKQESDERYIAKSGGAVGARYGIKWSMIDETDEGHRCFDAAGKTAVIAEGATLGISDFDSIYPWSEIKRCNIKHNANGASIVTFEGEKGFTLDGSNGDVFVRIPKFYIERYKQDGYEYRVISNAGAQVHEAFVEDGKELDEIFIAAFEGYIDADDHLRSIAGVIPTNNETPQTFLDAAKNNGANYSLYDMRCVDALWTLMAVEYGKRNSNKILGWGVADLYQAVNNGLLVLEAANGVNSIKVTKMNNTTKAFMPVGSNLTICDGTQQDIIAQRKITACVDATDESYTTITFDGDPVDVTTTCYVGSAACDTNWCEDCPQNALTTQHTGRAAWILTNGGKQIRNPIRYRWVENPVGNLWHYIPDVVFHNAQMYVCQNMKGYEFFKVDGAYKPIADLMPEQADNGNKSDVSGANYWIDSLLDDQFAKYVSIGKAWDKSYTSASAFGAYYYLRTNGTYGVANGGGFDHLWRCNMLTQRAWINETQRWYLYGARMMYKHID